MSLKKFAELKKIEANQQEMLAQQQQMLDQRAQSLQKQEYALEQDMIKFREAQKAERWRQNEFAVDAAIRTLPWPLRWLVGPLRNRAQVIKEMVYGEPESEIKN